MQTVVPDDSAQPHPLPPWSPPCASRARAATARRSATGSRRKRARCRSLSSPPGMQSAAPALLAYMRALPSCPALCWAASSFPPLGTPCQLLCSGNSLLGTPLAGASPSKTSEAFPLFAACSGSQSARQPAERRAGACWRRSKVSACLEQHSQQPDQARCVRLCTSRPASVATSAPRADA